MIGLLHPDARLVDGANGVTLGGSGLHDQVADLAAALDREPPGTVLAAMPTTVAAVLRFLASLHAGRPIALVDPRTDGHGWASWSTVSVRRCCSTTPR